jgi:hypothetical protein
MKSELKDILSLIAATVFADKRILTSEIDVFITSTLKLDIVKQLEPNISEAKLKAWFKRNKDDINQRLATPYYKDWLYEILDRLKDVPNKEPILKVMEQISIADQEVHVSERTLIALSERYWRENGIL